MLISFVVLIEEVHHHDIVLLPVPVTAADALLDPLGVPWEVIVHDKRAELQIDALGSGFRGNHDLSLLFEIVDERGAHVGGS